MGIQGYEPHIEVMPCGACDEFVHRGDLVELGPQPFRGARWHPYHAWCVRRSAPPGAPWSGCAECGGAFEREDIRYVLYFLATYGGIKERTLPPPKRLRIIRTVSFKRRRALDLFEDYEKIHAWELACHFELVHQPGECITSELRGLVEQTSRERRTPRVSPSEIAAEVAAVAAGWMRDREERMGELRERERALEPILERARVEGMRCPKCKATSHAWTPGPRVSLICGSCHEPCSDDSLERTSDG